MSSFDLIPSLSYTKQVMHGHVESQPVKRGKVKDTVLLPFFKKTITLRSKAE